MKIAVMINPLNAELNPIYHLLALLQAHHILHVSRIRVKLEAERYQQMSAIIWSRILCLPVCCQKLIKNITKYIQNHIFASCFVLLWYSYFSLTLGITHYGCLRTECSGGASWSALLMKYLHDQLRMNWVRYMASMDRRGAYRVLVGKPEGQTPLWGRRQRWDNTKIRIFFICTITNQCTTNWQIIILLLHVSTLLCHPQGACS